MNMPPPSHAGAQAQSPSMNHRAYPQSHAFLQQQQMYQQQQQMQQQAYLDASRGRKRKLTTQNAHLVRRPSGHGHGPQMHPPHMQHQQQQAPGFAGPRPPQSAYLGLHLPPTMADELPDSVVDDLDRLTPRDLAVARYARNHELLSTVFDARRIDTLQPAPSPYSQVKPEELQAKIDALDAEVRQMSRNHVEKLARVKQLMSGKHTSDEGASDDDTEAWAHKPFRGRVLGLGFVRASTPEELRPKPRPQEPASTPSDAEEQRRKEEKEAIEKLNATLGPDQYEQTDVVAPPAPPREAPSAPVLPHADANGTTETTQEATVTPSEPMDTSTTTTV